MRHPRSLLPAVCAVAAAYSCGGDETGALPEPPVNQAPVAVGTIPAQEIQATDTVAVELSGYFNDPDGDRLVYAATTSDAAVVTVSVSGGTLAAIAVGKGVASVAVTASDPGGLTAMQSLVFTVVGKPGLLQVTFQHPDQDLGAVVIHVDGPSIDSVHPLSGMIGYQVPVGSGFRAFVAGSLQGAGTGDGVAIVGFWSEDVSEAASYVATVEQAAATTYEQRSVEAAKATVVR